MYVIGYLEGKKITLTTWQNMKAKIACNNKKNNNKIITKVVLKSLRDEIRGAGPRNAPLRMSGWEAIPFAVPATPQVTQAHCLCHVRVS